MISERVVFPLIVVIVKSKCSVIRYVFISIPMKKGSRKIEKLPNCCWKQGAERKTRDEERRAAKRKLSATGSKEQSNHIYVNSDSPLTDIYFKDGRKKIEDMYHVATERSEFYAMSDVLKPPVLFTPSEELEKVRF